MHLQWFSQHGIPFTLIVAYIPLITAVATTVLSIVLPRATLRYAETPDKSLVFFATLVILGVFVITLGVGWMPLRRRLIGLISPSIATRLPPVPSRA